MNPTFIVISALTAICVAAALWTPHSMSRLRGRTLDLPLKKARIQDRDVVRHVIQEIRAGQLASTVLQETPELPLQIQRLLEVCADSGARAVPALDVVNRALAARERLTRHVAAEVSAPKATALLLACLPLFSWWLGSVLGASPLNWLLGSTWGVITLLVGLAMEVAGVLSIFAMARRVQELA